MGREAVKDLTRPATVGDLQVFQIELLRELSEQFFSTTGSHKPWLKNSEVRKLLGLSANTLQRLREAGKLHSKKLGGVHYYRYQDIEKMMNGSEE